MQYYGVVHKMLWVACDLRRAMFFNEKWKDLAEIVGPRLFTASTSQKLTCLVRALQLTKFSYWTNMTINRSGHDLALILVIAGRYNPMQNRICSAHPSARDDTQKLVAAIDGSQLTRPGSLRAREEWPKRRRYVVEPRTRYEVQQTCVYGVSSPQKVRLVPCWGSIRGPHGGHCTIIRYNILFNSFCPAACSEMPQLRSFQSLNMTGSRLIFF